MEKQISIECPCCASRLDVDVHTGAVLRWRRTERDEDHNPRNTWGAAAERVNRRMDSASEKLDESLARERKRTQDLDDLFRKANKQVGREEKE